MLKINIIRSRGFIYRKILGKVYLILSFMFFGIFFIKRGRNLIQVFELPQWIYIPTIFLFVVFSILAIVYMFEKLPIRGNIKFYWDYLIISRKNKEIRIDLMDIRSIVYNYNPLKYKAPKNRDLFDGGSNRLTIYTYQNCRFSYEIYFDSKENDELFNNVILGYMAKINNISIKEGSIPTWKYYLLQ
jgi:hypothetical protein